MTNVFIYGLGAERVANVIRVWPNELQVVVLSCRVLLKVLTLQNTILFFLVYTLVQYHERKLG